MGDYYGATLTIRSFPAYAVNVREALGYDGTRSDEAEIDFDAVEAKLADDLREGFVNEEQVATWDTLQRDLSHIGRPQQMWWSRDANGRTGTLEMEWSELSYGTFELEAQVLPTLRALGLPFFAHDDGKYENGGTFYEWRPGSTSISSGAYHSSRGKLLGESDWTHILGRTGSAEDAANAVDQFFSSDSRAQNGLTP